MLQHKAMEKVISRPIYELLHVKRDCNKSADRLASEALQQEKGRIVMVKEDQQDLRTLNQLDEL